MSVSVAWSSQPNTRSRAPSPIAMHEFQQRRRLADRRRRRYRSEFICPLRGRARAHEKER
jgi:hypothetical protein